MPVIIHLQFPRFKQRGLLLTGHFVAFFIPVSSPQKMGNTHTFQKARRAVLRLSVWQLALTLMLSGVALASSRDSAVSVLTGGMIGVVAGLYQAQRLLRVDASAYPESFMQGLWVSEVVKILLTGALFVLAIQLLDVQMVPTIVGYAVTYIVYWAALGTAYPWMDTPTNTGNLRDKNWPDA